MLPTRLRLARVAVLALLALVVLVPTRDAASYSAINTRFSIEPGTTVFSPIAHAAAVGHAGTVARGGRVDRSVDCTGLYPTCTACAENPACAWCKNLNRCVTELFTRMTCVDRAPSAMAAAAAAVPSRKNSNLGGLFGPEEGFDHVGKGAPNPHASCNQVFDVTQGLYRVHPDQVQVLSCDFLRQQRAGLAGAAAAADLGPCCGDGECGDAEEHASCPLDCKTQDTKLYSMDGALTGTTRLFGDRVGSIVHPQYHCHAMYEHTVDKRRIKWFLDRPSHDLQLEVEGGDVQLAPRSIVLELGCGDGRDSMYLASLGHHVTGVDIGPRAIRLAQRKARDRGLEETVQFLAYDALQLPEPSQPVDFIYDNTVYCNLRLLYLEKVLAMLERLTTPGHTVYMLNCGNAGDAALIGGHPRIRREAIEKDLGGLFEFEKVYEGVYDMDLSGPISRHAEQWNIDNEGVRSWTMLLRRKSTGSEEKDVEAA